MTTFWCESAYVDGAVREGVAITIAEGRFASVDSGAAPPTDDATVLRGVTLPGFANAHSHAFHRALRGRSQRGRGSFWTWREEMYSVAGRLDPDNLYRLARAVYGEMVEAGFTAVGEFHYVHHQPGGTPYGDPNEMGVAVLRAAADVGIRVTLLDTLYLHGGLSERGHEPLTDGQRRFSDGTVDAWVARVDRLALDGGQRVGAAIHSVRAVDPTSMAAVAQWAAERAVPLHAHVSEQPAENAHCNAAYGATPTELLHAAGALDERFTAVHATHLTDSDVELLAGSGATVCMCPTTERDLADGIGPTARFAASAIPMALGSDSHAVVDPFDEARSLELHERLRSGERGTHVATALVESATAAGHRSLGWDDAGSIAVGRRADLVTVTLDSVRTAGSTASDRLETVVFAASAADVTDVVIDGRHVVSGGSHRAIDTAAELQSAIMAVCER